MTAGKVTSAAQLLLGFISGAIHRRDGVYAIVDWDAAAGTATIEAIGDNTRFEIAVVQLPAPGEKT